jgi:hypothetical protein
MHPDAPYFSIVLCLMPDDFTCQVESAASTQWVKEPLLKIPNDTHHTIIQYPPNNFIHAETDYFRCLHLFLSGMDLLGVCTPPLPP